MYQLLSAVDHMHSKGYLHRDLKTSNLLYSNKGILCICDFGLARKFTDPPEKPYTFEVVTLHCKYLIVFVLLPWCLVTANRDGDDMSFYRPTTGGVAGQSYVRLCTWYVVCGMHLWWNAVERSTLPWRRRNRSNQQDFSSDWPANRDFLARIWPTANCQSNQLAAVSQQVSVVDKTWLWTWYLTPARFETTLEIVCGKSSQRFLFLGASHWVTSAWRSWKDCWTWILQR